VCQFGEFFWIACFHSLMEKASPPRQGESTVGGMVDKVLLDETEKEALLVEIEKADDDWAGIVRQRDRFGCFVQC
jgi:hypothetical protein